MSQITETDFDMSDFDDVSAMESDAKYRIITMDEDDDPRSKQVLKELGDKITDLYDDFRNRIKEVQESDAIKQRKAQLKEDSERILASAKTQITKVKENEDLKQVVDKGIQVAADAGNWIVDTIGVGVKEVMKQEPVQKLNANVNEKIKEFKEDERIKQGVASFKKSTLKIAENAFEGLKKVLDDEKTIESETEVMNDEKNNNL